MNVTWWWVGVAALIIVLGALLALGVRRRNADARLAAERAAQRRSGTVAGLARPNLDDEPRWTDVGPPPTATSTPPAPLPGADRGRRARRRDDSSDSGAAAAAAAYSFEPDYGDGRAWVEPDPTARPERVDREPGELFVDRSDPTPPSSSSYDGGSSSYDSGSSSGGGSSSDSGSSSGSSSGGDSGGGGW